MPPNKGQSKAKKPKTETKAITTFSAKPSKNTTNDDNNNNTMSDEVDLSAYYADDNDINEDDYGDFEDVEGVSDHDNHNDNSNSDSNDNSNDSDANSNKNSNNKRSIASSKQQQNSNKKVKNSSSTVSFDLNDYSVNSEYSFLNMEISELIAEISLNPILLQLKPFQQFLSQIQEDLSDTLKPQKSIQYNDNTNKTTQNYRNLFHFTESNSSQNFLKKLEIPFSKPTRVEYIGSYNLGISNSNSNDNNIDFALTMPVEMFNSEEDFKRFRYFHKRNLYLVELARQLQSMRNEYKNSLYIEFVSGDRNRPIITIIPSLAEDNIQLPIRQFLSKFRIRLFLQIEKSVFKHTKLEPHKKHLKYDDSNTSSNSSNSSTSSTSHNSSEILDYSTALYNSSILSDMFYSETRDQIEEMLENCDITNTTGTITSGSSNSTGTSSNINNNMKEALKLIRVWARQRNILSRKSIQLVPIETVLTNNSSKNSSTTNTNNNTIIATNTSNTSILSSNGHLFSSFHFSLILLHLYELRIVNKSMNSYQIFKQFLLFILRAEWQSGVILGKTNTPTATNSTNSSSYSAEDDQRLAPFRGRFPMILLHTNSTYNYCAYISNSSYQYIQYQAQFTLDLLNTNSLVQQQYSFSTLFIDRYEHYKQYDMFVKVPITTNTNSNSNSSNQYLDSVSVESMRLYSILKQAYTDRIKLLNVTIDTNTNSTSSTNVILSVLLNPTTYQRILDRGPSAENKQLATAYRAFWGTKSEQRRFADGSILEACLWNSTNDNSKNHNIVAEITQYILSLHCSYLHSNSKLTILYNQLDSLLLLRENPYSSPTLVPVNTHTSNTSIIGIFRSLQSMIKSCTDIPLSIINIRSNAPIMRQTAPFPPMPIDLQHIIDTTAPNTNNSNSISLVNYEVIPVTIQFESSPKWPDDLLAIARIKSAFYIKISDELKRKYPTEIHTLVATNSVTVFYQQYAFAISIYYDAELTLRKIRVDNNQEIIPKTSGLFPIESSYSMRREYEIMPLFTQSIRYIQSVYPNFNFIARIFKRWLRAHLFSNAVMSDESAELLVVAALQYTNSTYNNTNSYLTGLMVVLQFIQLFDFNDNCLIIEFDKQFNTEELDQIQAEFVRHRNATSTSTNSLLSKAIYIATDYDRKSDYFTAHTPTPHHFTRLIHYCKSSYQHLHATLNKYDSNPINYIVPFKTPLTSYDAIIRLNPNILQQNYLNRSLTKLEQSSADTATASANSAHNSKSSRGFVESVDDRIAKALAHQKAQKSKKDNLDLNHYITADFNVIDRYQQDLRANFDFYADFYYDQFGGHMIAVQLKEHIRAFIGGNNLKSFTVNQSTYTLPQFNESTSKSESVSGNKTKKEKKNVYVKKEFSSGTSEDAEFTGCQFDLGSFYNDIQILGQGIVADIQINTQYTK